MTLEKKMDHLFRHQYGKMVSILTRIFGLTHLETIEDAVQDTFLKASITWRKNIPKNPEAWLTAAAKNRVVDLLRKIKSEDSTSNRIHQGAASISINNLFLEHEIEDSQLRMIFTACHPALKPRDQIAFALKTFAGFSGKEIASALLLNGETVKKRLQRARKTIKNKQITFELPVSSNIDNRLNRVHEVIYLIFNEGFHSNRKEMLIRRDLCGEALRLCKLVLKKEDFRTGSGYALLALMCFHASRLDSKTDSSGKIVDLKNQNRSLWYQPLIQLGKNALNKSVEFKELSSFHLEASIAMEHVSANSFAETDWNKILKLYQALHDIHQTPFSLLNQAIVYIQLNSAKNAIKILDQINPKELEQRSYLYYGALAEYYILLKEYDAAMHSINKALHRVTNFSEKSFLEEKKIAIQTKIDT